MNIKNTINRFHAGNKLIKDAARTHGLKGFMKATLRDLFGGFTWYQALYTLLLGLTPLAIELISNGQVTDWLGLFGSTTGILCVIYVSFGRASNYLFGTLNAALYLILSVNASFYGEVVTTVYFFIMQPIGLWLWLVNSLENKEETKAGDVKIKSLSLLGWVKWLSYTAVIWLLMGLAYQGIGSARPFRDSITDGTNYTGQMLMNNLYWVTKLL